MQTNTNKVMTEAELDEVARVRQWFVAVMLAASVITLLIDLFII